MSLLPRYMEVKMGTSRLRHPNPETPAAKKVDETATMTLAPTQILDIRATMAQRDRTQVSLATRETCGQKHGPRMKSLVQNDKDRTDLIFEACGYLASLMARYSRLQAHYWARQVKGGKPLEDAIINVYKAILVYPAAVKQSLNSTAMNRVKLSFISLTGQPLEKLKKQVGEEDKRVEQWQQQIDRERQDEDSRKLGEIETKADSFLEKLDRAVDDMDEVKDMVLAKELQEMLDWLFKDTADQHEMHKELRDAIEEPGEWFIRGHQYVEWKKYPQSLLWLFGSSGCGNLLSGVPDKNMLEWFQRSRETAVPMKTAELIDKLITFIGKIDKDVFIVLDGLDELPTSGSGRELLKFLAFVTNLISSELVNLHVLLVSKDIPDIRSRLTPGMDDILAAADVKKGLDNDLDDYITKRLNKMSILSRTLKEDVKRRLNEGQERNFLWSTSLLNEVAKCRNANEVPGVLQKVPTSMVAVYEAVLISVTKDDEQLMRSILIWLMSQFNHSHETSLPPRLE
ncbi:hypothetical protein GE09DRAFT_1214089 [Coniochaeta sp. 2T2.1]|nr:hypothetical protein GE09DRAFT_1214089 [Coniochaeta sp. 2T2.1]